MANRNYRKDAVLHGFYALRAAMGFIEKMDRE